MGGQLVDQIQVIDADDPLVGDFTSLNDPVIRRQIERAGDYFVVEGILAIERLLGLPEWNIRSLLFLPRVAERFAPLVATRGGAIPPVYVADEDVLNDVVGFDLHRGALASVDRRPALQPTAETVGRSGLLLVAEGVNDHENLGALYRNAAAFGVRAVVLDPRCADPFYRRAVRVSLGHVLAMPTIRTEPFPDGLSALHDLGVTTLALTPSGDRDLLTVDRAELGPGPVAVLVGAEGPGLSAETMASAHHRVSIEMASDVDSLNVATAAAIALHHLRER